jgi:hypothetical protein
MALTLKQRWDARREHWRRRFMPRLATWLARLATYQARQALKASGPLTLLVDNTVVGHAVTHETAWVSTGTSMWGGVHPIETGYRARIPVHPVDSDAQEYEHIKQLGGIAHLAREGHLILMTSAELRDEQFRQPSGRYRGYGAFDYSLFSGVHLKSVDGLVGPTLGPSWMGLPSPAEQQRARLNDSGDGLYEALVKVLGEKNSQDAWHIRTAERHGMFCFLTMDFRLVRTVRQHAHREPLNSLKTLVLTPAEFGERLKLAPLPPHLCSYNDASFFVRGDLSMPGGKRRPLSAYRKGTRT